MTDIVGGSEISVPPVTVGSMSTIRENILARIQEITAAPKPNYNIDGQQVSWHSYLDSLMKSLELIDQRINVSEPFEFVSRGYT